MAGGRHSVSKAKPCAICGHGSWCRWWPDSEDQAVEMYCCFRYAADGISAPTGWRAVGPVSDRGGQTFAPSGFDVQRRTSPERRAEREKTEAQLRAKSIESARRLWKIAEPGRGHPRIAEYLAARGVSVDRLPGGKVPPTLRYVPECYRRIHAEEKGQEDTSERVPAIVCAAKGPDNKVRAVQRIYLNRAGLPQKVEDGEAKKAMGSLSGAAVRLRGPCTSGVLILCEGVETGLAIQAAVGDRAAVWACVSTSGLIGAELPAEQVEEHSPDRWIRRIIVAGDADRAKKGTDRGPGEQAAKVCINQILARHTHLGAKIALPSREAACAIKHVAYTAMFDADGSPAGGGKSVDWLDVYDAIGADATAREVMGEWLGATAEAVYRMWPATKDEQVKTVLSDLYLPTTRENSGLCLTRWNEQWWQCEDGGDGEWVNEPVEFVESRATDAMDKYWKMTKKDVVPLAPTVRTAQDVLKSALKYVACRAEQMPCWLPSHFDTKGEPKWFNILNGCKWAPAGPIDPVDVIATADGLIDASAWCRGELRVLPHSPRWFSTSRMPVKLPLETIHRALRDPDGIEVHALVAKMCPLYINHLQETFEDDADSIAAMWRWNGYILTSDCRLEKMGWCQGPSGTGKGVLSDVQVDMLGPKSIAMTDIDSLGEKFDLAPLVGKLCVQIREGRSVGRNVQQSINRILMLASNDWQAVEEKHEKKNPLVRPNCKVFFTPNAETRLPDESVAILRRIIVWRTRDEAPERPDPFLKDKLKAEIPGIFLGSMMGLREMRADMALGRPGIKQPSRGQEIIDRIEQQSAPIRQFVRECCVVGEQFSVRTELLLREWDMWREANDYAEMNAATFGKGLAQAVPRVKRVLRGGRGDREYMYEGVRVLLSMDDAKAGPLARNTDESLAILQHGRATVCGSSGEPFPLLR